MSLTAQEKNMSRIKKRLHHDPFFLSLTSIISPVSLFYQISTKKVSVDQYRWGKLHIFKSWTDKWSWRTCWFHSLQERNQHKLLHKTKIKTLESERLASSDFPGLLNGNREWKDPVAFSPFKRFQFRSRLFSVGCQCSWTHQWLKFFKDSSSVSCISRQWWSEVNTDCDGLSLKTLQVDRHWK